MKENIRHVLLRVETVTRDEEGKEEQISLQVPGISGIREGVPYIQYEESGQAGMEGVTTTITCPEELVILERTGSVSQRQEYRRGETTQSPYGNTEYCGDYQRTAGPSERRPGTAEVSLRYFS